MTTPQEDRIYRAQAAIAAYRTKVGLGLDNEEVVSDLLADLMHYSDYLTDEWGDPLDFNNLLATAEMNYQAEIEENK